MEINYRFGLELEFARKTNREKLSQIISSVCPEDIVLITSWQKNTNNIEWICKTDSSCGYEVCTPVFDSLEDLDKLQKVLKAFKKNQVHITKSCGVHLHLESKHFNIYQVNKILINWINFEPIIFLMFPEYRRNNRFCLPISSFVKDEKYSPSDLIKNVSKHKNRSLNIRGYSNRGTIEFRLMEGSVENKDIINWVVFCQKFVENSLEKKKCNINQDVSVLKLINFLEISKEDEREQDLQSWINQRIRKFA